MLTGELKAKVDRIWDAFWSGGIANPLEVMEQITYLLFIRRLDELQTGKENKANRFGASGIADLPGRVDDLGRPYEELRWSRFKDFEPGEMFAVVSERVFPFLRSLAARDRPTRTTCGTRVSRSRRRAAHQGRGLARRAPDGGPRHQGRHLRVHARQDRAAGQNGQFRTPRHIIQLMVAMTAPTPKDEICDPACGTAGFLIAASEYCANNHPEMLRGRDREEALPQQMFHGFDFDSTMLRIGSMNMLLHDVEVRTSAIGTRSPRDAATRRTATRSSWRIRRSPAASTTRHRQDLLRVVQTKKTELLFVALSSAYSSPVGGLPSSSRTACSSGRATPTRSCAGFSSRTRSSMPSCSSRAASSVRTPAFDGDPAVHAD